MNPFRNLALIGPPGSGKGSYGRHLAKALNLSVLGVSDVLRRFQPDMDLSSGQLVPDEVVTDALLRSFRETDHQRLTASHTGTGGFLLDGFPRTKSQIQIMEERWPNQYQIHAALKLAVPDTVCESKLLGRRMCPKCNGNFNVNGVDSNGWYLPPFLPTRGSETDSLDCSFDACSQYWIQRADDQPGIVRERLETYHSHMDPILDYFEERGKLLKLTPHRGYEDIPEMISTVKEWLAS